MRWTVLVAVMLMWVVTDAGASGPLVTVETLKGPQIADALTARTLGYPSGQTQTFFADGRTLYGAEQKDWGHWRVEGDQYCSQWPPSDRWACYGVTRDGLEIGFVAGDGSVTTGSYVDLQ